MVARVGKKVLPFVFFFFTGISAFGALLPLAVTLEPNPVGVRDNTTLVVDLPLSSSAGVDAIAPDLPSGVSIWRGPYIRFYRGDDYAQQGVDHFVRISYTLRASRTGRMVIPSFRFLAEEGEFETPPLLLEVGLYRSGHLQIPFEPYWELGRQSVYAGETVPVTLKVPMQREVRLVDDVSVRPPREGFFEETGRVGAIDRSEIEGFSFYTLPAAGYLLTPERSGNLQIPSAFVTIDGIREQADALDLNVLPLPDAVAATGAVGSFEYKAASDKGPFQEGDRFFVTVTLSGKGNLPYLSIPEPILKGASLISSSEKSEIDADADGFAGRRIVRFEFLVSGKGTIEISYPPFPFLIPSSGRVSMRYLPSSTVRVEDSEHFGTAEGETPFSFEPLPIAGFSVTNEDSYRNLRSYLWLLPGPLLFLVFLIFGRKRRSIATVSILFFFMSAAGAVDEVPPISDEKALAAYAAGDDEAAYQEYLLLLETSPDNSRLCYNCAVTAYRASHVGKAVFYARQAFRTHPSDGKMKELVNAIEKREGFGFQAPLPFSVHPDLFFFLLMLSINGAGFVAVFYLLHRKNLTFIVAVLLFTIGVASAIALGFSAADWGRQVVVAQADLPVLSIPDSGAGTSFVLREGEAVTLLGRSRDYLFIETGINTSGWVPLDQVLILGPMER
ncbi:tetratricopeptide repeat protein [Sediminispirochaeta bajacaliforniensis]|uniref:tetratricopeptide repeat protein n=1 Tax=Sediminispirochaeta bajacaliforniensis TaxID=148 RepID=UPI00037BAB06|nr:BatD family protein [Sediminispirochaeta bajacaliforniensis]